MIKIIKKVVIFFFLIPAMVRGQDEETIGLKFKKTYYINNVTNMGDGITKRFNILSGEQGKPTSIVRIF